MREPIIKNRGINHPTTPETEYRAAIKKLIKQLHAVAIIADGTREAVANRIITSLEDEYRSIRNGNVPDISDKFVRSISKINRSRWVTILRRNLLRARADDYVSRESLLGGPREIISDAIASNVDLVTDVLDEQRRLLRNTILDEFSNPKESLVDRIKPILDKGNNRASLIADDQTAKINSRLSKYRFELADVEEYEWSNSRDEKVRKLHISINGIIYRWDQPTGAENGDIPGVPIRCRCVALAVFR